MDPAPHIILCTCDQLRAFETGCHGNPIIRTPSVDRLAREGVRFEHAVTNFPVCMAARSVLVSGQYNRSSTGGVSNVAYPTRPGDYAMPEYPIAGRPHLRDTTLAEALRAAGYDTAVVGKWHIHSWPDDVGFDEYLIPRVHHCHSGQSFTRNGGPEFVPAGWSVEFEAAEVERFLNTPGRGKRPFLLYYSISPPHCPVADAPVRIRTMYAPEDVPLRDNVDPIRPLESQEHWFRVYRWDFRYYSFGLPHTLELPPGYGLRQLIAEYYGMVTWMDEAIGRMLAALDATGLAENTIVVFTSDHGDNLGSLGLVQKGGPNEESIRIPLIVWAPGRLHPRVADGCVASLVDIAPTLLDLAGVPIPKTMQGQSLVPALDGGLPPRVHAVVETGSGAAVRTPSHLYHVPFEPGTRTLAGAPSMFHDLQDDPFELRNLAGTGEQAQTAQSCDALLRQWDRSTPWMAGT
ncbi:MAG TPA: sulfatase-like hydrolase/transferase [Armatimonadota bacterium]|nr:sulfatase-like hydrolase/transferase [Armatimonadota bacterium]